VNIKFATATLGAALILAGSPAFAADEQSGPIHIDNVQIYGGNTTDANDSTIIVPGSTAIAFTNHYGVPATDVVFTVGNHGYIVDRFDDAGSFATGVTINHKFAENLANPEMRVAVEKATFADGTVWVNPAVAQPTQADTTVGVAASDGF
jgi:hypothetical protein